MLIKNMMMIWLFIGQFIGLHGSDTPIKSVSSGKIFQLRLAVHQLSNAQTSEDIVEAIDNVTEHQLSWKDVCAKFCQQRNEEPLLHTVMSNISLFLKNDIVYGVQRLIEAGVDVEERHNGGSTPLQHAQYCLSIYPENTKEYSIIIDALLKAGADTTIADNKGRTPLRIMGKSTMSPLLVIPACKTIEGFSV